MISPNPDELRFILESGILAPSADNHHDIRFEQTSGGLRVWYSGNKPLPETGYKRVLVLVSLGAMSENLTVAASRFGWDTSVELFPDPTTPNLVFQLTWHQKGTPLKELWQAIPFRHTNRRLIFHGPISSPDQRARLSEAVSLRDCNLIWLDSPRLRRRALRLIRWAESERFHSQLLHKELFSAIRFDIGWRTSCNEGIPPGALGIEPPLRPAFTLLRHWTLMKAVNLIGGYRLLGWRAASLPCRLSPHLGLIAANSTDDSAIFAAGRAFEHVWLAATRMEYVIQPMPAAALYTWQGDPHTGIGLSLQRRLKSAWSEILPNGYPIMLFRMGRAAPLPVNTSRHSVTYYMKS